MRPETEDLPDIVKRGVRAAIAAGVAVQDMPDYVADWTRAETRGTTIYTRMRSGSPQERAAAIRSAFNGRNIDDLARAHGITPRRVRQILSGD